MTQPTAEAASSAPDAARARRYHRLKRALSLADFSLGLAFLVVLLAAGWTHALRDWALAAAPGSGWALAYYLAAFLALAQGIGFPLDLASGYWAEHRFGLSTQRLAGWLADWLKGFGLRLALGVPAGSLVYWALARHPEHWWLLCAAVFIVVFLLLAHLAPVLLLPLFFKFRPLEDKELRQRLLRLSERAGARVRGGVWLWKLSAKTRKANAALVGWGRTRRILLADTLVEHHTPDEIEAILAHELAHHRHRDIPRGLALQAALTLAGFYLVHRALAAWSAPLGFAGPADFASLPLLLLVATGASLAVLPAVNALSRRRERAADRFALELTRQPEAFIWGMEKLAERNLAERQPHPLIEFIFYTHPPVEKRIAFARTWAPAGQSGQPLAPAQIQSGERVR